MNNSFINGFGSGETRRSFIKKTATAAAAAVVGGNLMRSSGFAALDTANSANPPGVNGPATPGDLLTIGVIGLGSQGMANLRNLLSHASESNIKVGAVCDLWDKRREAGRKAANLPENRAFENYEDLLNVEEIDAVLVATHDVWHTKITIDAMNSGRHVYVEKPMTRYLHEAFEIYDTAKRTGMTLQVGTQFCAHPVWSKSAELVRNGDIGPLVLAQASYMRNSGRRGEWNYNIDPDLTPDSVDFEKWLGQVPDREFDPDAFFRWRKYFPFCAGVIGDLMPHRVGPLLLGTGTTEFPSRVVCLGTRAIQTDRSVCDNTQMVAEFPSGFAIQVISGTVNEQGLPDMIRGHHATLTMGGGRLNLNPERPFSDVVDPQNFNVPATRHLVADLQKNWISCIRDGGEPLVGPERSIRLQTILSLAEISERLNVMCLFDEKSRKITTGDGREVEPITYGSHEV